MRSAVRAASTASNFSDLAWMSGHTRPGRQHDQVLSGWKKLSRPFEQEASCMRDVASICAMHQFHFGRSIRCSDGEAGLLTQVVFDAASRRVTALGVTLGGWFGRRVYVSFATVVPVTGESIALRISRAVLAASRKEAPAGALLDSKSVVENDHPSGTAAKGTLQLIAVHPQSGALAYLVAHHLRPRQDSFLRAEDVTQIETGHVEVSL